MKTKSYKNRYRRPLNKISLWRLFTLIALFSLLVVLLLAQAVRLIVVDGDFLLNQGDLRTIRHNNTPAYRGLITDRIGEPLAVSAPVNSLWVNPQQVDLSDDNWNIVATIVGESVTDLRKRIQNGFEDNKQFIYLQRHLSPAAVQELPELKLSGLYINDEFKRYYPAGEVAAHILGFANIDDEGQEGVEYIYNDWLAGVGGKIRVLQNRLGQVIEVLDVTKTSEDGHNVTLSIDSRIQYLAYRSLKKAVSEHDAKAGSVVVLDVKTGEVLAMVNQPAFNPNDRRSFKPGDSRNRAVVDQYEPGSVLKTFAVLAALDSGVYTQESIFDTSPGTKRIKDHTVRDFRDYGVLSLGDVLKKSSNVGSSMIALSLDADTISDLLYRFGFSARTGVVFPGEVTGSVPFLQDRNEVGRATLSFGYGMTTTTLQLARAYAALANNGYLLPITLLKTSPLQVPKGEAVISQRLAQDLMLILESVVSREGSGSRAAVPGYRVAGKTGTARKLDVEGYSATKHRSLFAGFAPVSDPRVAIVVMIDEPSAGVYYGGLVAAPVFADIMSGTMRLLGVPPDDTQSADQS